MLTLALAIPRTFEGAVMSLPFKSMVITLPLVLIMDELSNSIFCSRITLLATLTASLNSAALFTCHSMLPVCSGPRITLVTVPLIMAAPLLTVRVPTVTSLPITRVLSLVDAVMEVAVTPLTSTWVSGQLMVIF